MFGTVSDYERERVSYDPPATGVEMAQDLERIGRLAIEAHFASLMLEKCVARGDYKSARRAAIAANRELAGAIEELLANID